MADEAAALETEAARREPATVKLRRAVDARRAKSAGLQTRLHEIEDRIFESFSRKVPLPPVMWAWYVSARDEDRIFENFNPKVLVPPVTWACCVCGVMQNNL